MVSGLCRCHGAQRDDGCCILAQSTFPCVRSPKGALDVIVDSSPGSAPPNAFGSRSSTSLCRSSVFASASGNSKSACPCHSEGALAHAAFEKYSKKLWRKLSDTSELFLRNGCQKGSVNRSCGHHHSTCRMWEVRVELVRLVPQEKSQRDPRANCGQMLSELSRRSVRPSGALF